ncbi:MAG: hypothetical protein WCD04_18320 [Terriglobia bacterium]
MLRDVRRLTCRDPPGLAIANSADAPPANKNGEVSMTGGLRCAMAVIITAKHHCNVAPPAQVTFA